MREGWKILTIAELVEINPPEKILKGALLKKVSMDKLIPYCKFIPEFELTKYNGGVKFRNGDTIMARITPCLENGKTSQVNILVNNEVGFGSTEYIVFRARKNISDLNFIYYLISSSTVREPAIKSMVGTSGRQRVQTDVVKAIKVKIPPLKTQQQVAQVLSSLDDKIELNNAINKNLEEQAQAIFKSWFVDFEPFGGTMPDDWEISSLFENSYCNFIKPSISSFSGEKTYIATADVNLNKIISKVTKITYKKRPSRANMEPCLNSIWFAKMKNSRKNILINNAWEQNYNKLILSTGFYGIKILSNALHYFWCIISSEQFDMIKNGFCNGTTMQAINNDGVSKINIVIPSEKIIYQFNEKISPLFELIEKNNIENERLSSLRDTLLPKLMSGEIDVSNVKVTAEVMRV